MRRSEPATADGPFPMVVGDVRVHPLLDGVMPMPLSVLYPDVPEAVWRSISADLTADGRLTVPYGGFLAVDSSGTAVVIDTGGGPTPAPLPDGSSPVRFGELPSALSSLGVGVEQVDLVVLTHFHPDHIGWAAVDGAPFFPNASYYVHEREWATLDTEHEAYEALQPIAPQLRTWSGAQAAPLPWLSLHHAPGHSPGNTVVDWATGVQVNMQSASFKPEAYELVMKLLKEHNVTIEGLSRTKGGRGSANAVEDR